MPLTAYVLTAQWELDEAGLHVQTVRFTTGRDASGCPPDVCLRGKLAFRTSGRRLSISVTPAVGQRIQVEMRRGKRMCATRQRGRCPKRNRWFLGYSSTQRSLRLRGARATVRLPPRVRGLNALWISVRLDGPFTAQGRKWLGAHVTATDFHAR